VTFFVRIDRDKPVPMMNSAERSRSEKHRQITAVFLNGGASERRISSLVLFQQVFDGCEEIDEVKGLAQEGDVAVLQFVT
jgi:hypothetical protein